MIPENMSADGDPQAFYNSAIVRLPKVLGQTCTIFNPRFSPRATLATQRPNVPAITIR